MVVVEHDLTVLRSADYFIELGPGPGHQGGQVVYQGPLAEFLAQADSLTAAYLQGKKRLAGLSKGLNLPPRRSG